MCIHIINQVRAEVAAAVEGLGEDGGEGLETLPHEAVFKLVSKHMPYTKACVSEGLR